MNCISWNVGHLAWQEQRYFCSSRKMRCRCRNQCLVRLRRSSQHPAASRDVDGVGCDHPAADPWLEALTIEQLQAHVVIDGQPTPYLIGSLLQRVIYHYWYHAGENLAIRQMLGHTDLPEFVGDIDAEAPYRPELS